MKTLEVIKRAALLGVIAGMAAVFNVSAFAQSGTLVWSGAAADGQWSGANWMQIGGGGNDIAYINDTPFTFSASFNAADKTITPLDGTVLHRGQIISAVNSLLQYSFNSVNNEIASGTYNLLNNWGVYSGTGSVLASSGVIALFNAHTGAVTVSGTQYMQELRFDNGGSTVLNTSSGTLFFSPGYDAVNLTASNGASAEIKADMDSRFLNFNVAMTIRNNGSGTLAFTGNAIHAKNGIVFNNSNGGYLTKFNNVTLDNNGAYLYFKRGTFDFNGVTSTVNTGQIIIGEDGDTTFNINANAVLDLSNSSWLVLGRKNDPAVTNLINIAGELKSGGSDLSIADSGAGTAIIALSGTGKLTTPNNRVIYVGSGGSGVGKLLVGDNAASTASVVTQKIMVGNNASSGYLTVSGSSTITTASPYGTLSIANGSGYGEANFNDNSVLTANYISIASSSGTGVLSLNGNAKITTTTQFEVAGGSGLGTVNLRDNSRIEVGNVNIALGKTGTAIVNVYNQAVLQTAYDFKIGNEGGAGSAILNVYSGTVQGTNNSAHGYLYINSANDVNGSSGIVNLSGGVIDVNSIVFGSGNNTVGTGKAYLNITGGELKLLNNNGLHTGNWNAASGEALANHTASDTQINLGGGKITATNGLTSNMNMTLTGSNGNIKFNAPSQTIQLGGNLTGSGGLEVTAGTLLLKGAGNHYDGQTVVDTGASFTLDSAASLTLSLSALEADGNRFAFDGSGYLNLNGTVNLDFTGATGTEWNLINTSLIATMSNNWLAGFTKDSSDDIWTKGDYTFRLDTGILSVIPEPSTWTLLFTGAALLAFLRRKK